jgi:tRNA dimethylallyltransferase
VNKVIVIVGPTAIGKTELSIRLAKQFPLEIINGDAMQVYQGMDIGTGKVTEKEKQGINHYMLNIKKPDESFSVAEYKAEVDGWIKQICKNGKIPLIVGGSGLYIQAVLYDFPFKQPGRNEKITKLLEDRLQKEGNEVLYKELISIDPKQSERIHPNNHRRLIRALEIYQTTGLTMTEMKEKQTGQPVYEHFIIGLTMERKHLYERINSRVNKMIEIGLLDEVKRLHQQGFAQTQAMKAIGYKEFIPFLEGETSFDTAVDILKRNSRRYAKRQLTWFNHQMPVEWYDMDDTIKDTSNKQIMMACQDFLEK